MDILTQVPLTLNTVNAGLVAGTTTTVTVTLAPTGIVIGGKFGTVTLSASGNQSIEPTVDANTGVAFAAVPINSAACLLLGINAAGTLVGALGPVVPTETGVTTTVGAFINAPQFPAIPSNFCPVAYTLIRVAPSLTAGFIVGSTQWAASGASCTTFKNICTLPDRPQIA